MTVTDIARTDIVTVDLETPVQELAEIMTDAHVGSVVVTDDTGALAGIVTDRDLAVYVCRLDRVPEETTARNVMATDVFTVRDDAGIFDALSAMADEPVRRAPVVDADGRLRGIVTLDDFVVLLSRELDRVSSIIEAESPPYPAP
ncbi:MAG: CBS domain-containing protein [Haloarculaceae archaeon]